jgi:hypothetical protein
MHVSIEGMEVTKHCGRRPGLRNSRLLAHDISDIATSLPKKGPSDQTKRQDKASSDPHDELDLYRRHANPFLTFQWI